MVDTTSCNLLTQNHNHPISIIPSLFDPVTVRIQTSVTFKILLNALQIQTIGHKREREVERVRERLIDKTIYIYSCSTIHRGFVSKRKLNIFARCRR